jgi:hypothetical protein
VSNLILFGLDNEAELIYTSDRLKAYQIDHIMFFEPDDGMGYSAICTRPILEKFERKFFNKYKLYAPLAQ